MVTGQGITGQRSRFTGQGSLVSVNGHWSRVTGQSDPSKGWEIMQCSNETLKSVTDDDNDTREGQFKL